MDNIAFDVNPKERDYLTLFGLISEENTLHFKKDNFVCVRNIFIKFNSEAFFDNIYSSLIDFINIFNLYLSEIVYTFLNNIKPENIKPLEVIGHKINKFYTFNYTPTLEILYGIENNRTSFIHGKFDLRNHNIVLGIDEIDGKLKDDKLFMFTKYYQKLFNNTDYQFLSELETSTAKNYDFIVFGHSLAQNDRNYVVELFEKAKQHGNTVSIFYLNSVDKAQKLKNILSIVGRDDVESLMKKRILAFVKIDENPFQTIFSLLPESKQTPGIVW